MPGWRFECGAESAEEGPKGGVFSKGRREVGGGDPLGAGGGCDVLRNWLLVLLMLVGEDG
jgi:hypothetical protein